MSITILPAPDSGPETDVSRGVGSRMLDYLRRTYQGYTPQTQTQPDAAPCRAPMTVCARPPKSVTVHPYHVCPTCGRSHAGTGRKCDTCYRHAAYESGNPHYICPRCGGYKDISSRVCATCRRKE